MLRSGSAASSCDVQKPFLSHRLHSPGHLNGALVVLSHLVRKPGIRVAAQRTFGPLCDILHQGSQVLSPKRTVKPEAQGSGVFDAGIKSFYRLAGKGPSAAVGSRGRNHKGQLQPALAQGIDGGFGIKGIEAGLKKQNINTSAREGFYLLFVAEGHFVEAVGPEEGVRELLGEGEGFARRADTSGYPDLPPGPVGFASGYPCSLKSHLGSHLCASVLSLADSVGGERIGLDNVCSRLDVCAVDARHFTGVAEGETLAVAAQACSLEHSTHCPVQNQDTALQCT